MLDVLRKDLKVSQTQGNFCVTTLKSQSLLTAHSQSAPVQSDLNMRMIWAPSECLTQGIYLKARGVNSNVPRLISESQQMHHGSKMFLFGELDEGYVGALCTILATVLYM